MEKRWRSRLALQSYPVTRGANLATDSLVISQPNLSAPRPAVADAWHTVLLLVVSIAWGAWGYFGAARMRVAPHPHRAAMYIFTILLEWCVVAYIAWGVHRHGSSLREVIGGRWNSATDFLKDAAIAAGFWILALVVLLCTAVALHTPRGGEAIRFLLPQTRVEILLWVLTSMTAGICEETIFRGYFQKQFIAWTGNVAAGVLLSAAAFGAGHIYQGGRSAILIAVYGLLFGILAETRKSLRPGMMTHAWHDGFAGLAGRLLVK
jgi:CAAX protease family protein